jgi:GTPase-associated protein 1, N-terminal domain type 1
LFGYADGHRQIASSVRLPPKDLFLLSSASDLAGGARLGERNSYLSGLLLPDSRIYALFRTWAAPEMPRPGCVWSHVLLLGPKASASIPALSEVLPLFRRPVADEISSYGSPLENASSRYVEPARADLISDIIAGYYIAGRAILSPDSGDPNEIENAILAVWSQQWPRLRSSFSFCTASLSENRRAGESDYGVQVAPLDGSISITRERWVSFAAADAAENRVTPLRRFLWRYGRDISASRRQYRMLVELYMRFEDVEVISADEASDVLQALPDPSDGAVLKRDILGIGPSSPRLIAALSVVDFLQLLTSEALPETPTAAQVGERLEELSSREIGDVARYYAANKEALSPWKEQIYGTIIALADKSSITTEYPKDMVADVLLARTDLVDPDTLPLIANDILFRFIKDGSSASSVVMSEVLRRDLGDLEDEMISSHPDLVFQSAVRAYCENRLHQSWLGQLAHRVGTILAADWLPQLKSTKEFAAALSILRYPRHLAKGSAEIAKCMSEMVDDAQGDERTTMQAALLRTSIDEGSAESWHLISIVLPELRVVVINASLSRTAESMLVSDLPHFSSAGYWDLDRRILLSLSKLNLVAPNRDALDRLSLTPAEMELVLHGEERPARKSWLWFS